MDKHKKDLLIGFLIYVSNILLMYYLWQNNIALTVIFIVISAFVLLKWADKEEKIVYFASFVLGPILDLILIPRGVWAWGNPSLFGIPLWLPLFYGILTVTAIKIGKSAAKLLKNIQRSMYNPKKEMFIGFLVFVIDILFFYFFWESNIVLTALLLTMSAVVLIWLSSKEEKILYFICFVLAPVFDLILVPGGAWTYGNPFIFGIPLWLPVGYGLSTVMIVKIGNSIARLIK